MEYDSIPFVGTAQKNWLPHVTCTNGMFRKVCSRCTIVMSHTSQSALGVP